MKPKDDISACAGTDAVVSTQGTQLPSLPSLPSLPQGAISHLSQIKLVDVQVLPVDTSATQSWVFELMLKVQVSSAFMRQ